MTLKTNHLIAAVFAASMTCVGLNPARADDASSEPSIDELLGLDDGPDAEVPNDEPADAEEPDDADADAVSNTDPQLTRDLDKALTGQQAADQFAQAIEDMEEVAIRLADEADPGIDTQRLQDEIILKLEQIIASAEKSQSQQKPKPGQGQPQPGPPRQADRPGQQQAPQPGEQPGQQPGDQQAQGEKPGEQQGEQPGQQAQGEQPGEGEGQSEQAQQAGGQHSGQGGSRGSVRTETLSMKDLREGEWGNLPPRLRDELAESLSETFNPVYREATEAFYRRIAEMSQEQAEEQQ
ncbi:MAG: hypothetical protein ACPGYV_05585 [Phycisphaeraceae bacterium]